MDPELKALIDKYKAANASDDQIMQMAADWKRQHATGSVEQAPTTVPASQGPPAAPPGFLQRAASTMASIGNPSMPRPSDFQAFTPGNLATEAQNLGQMIPGGKSLQAVSQMLPKALGGQGMSYPDAYNYVGRQVAGLPTSHKVIAALAAAVATGKIPVSAAAMGAAAPAINSLLNPRQTTWGNAAGTVAESAVGASLPSALQMIASRVKSGLAPTADVVANEAHGNRISQDEINYSQVGDEAAAAGGTNPAIQAALADPKIASYVNAVRRLSPENITDAEVLTKVRALMSQRQGAIIPADAVDPGIGSKLEKQFLGRQKGALTQAAVAPGPEVPSVQTAQSPPPDLRTAIGNFWDRQAAAAARSRQGETVAQNMARSALERHGAEAVVSPSLTGEPPTQALPAAMPSLPGALEATAEGMQARNAGDLAAKVARRQFSGTLDPTNSDKLEKLGLAGYAQEASSNTPAEQKMALDRVLAELKNYPLFARLGSGRFATHIPIPLVPGLATRQAPAMLKAVGGVSLPDFITRLLTNAAISPFGR